MKCKFNKDIQKMIRNPGPEFLRHLRDCPDCQKDVAIAQQFKDALIEQLSMRAEKSPDCPDDETLTAYLDGLLPEDGADKVVGHLAECTACRREIFHLQNLNLEAAKVPLAPIPERKQRWQPIVRWFEPIFAPAWKPIPVAAFSMLVVAIVATTWLVFGGVKFDPQQVAHVLELGRKDYPGQAQPEIYSVTQINAGHALVEEIRDEPSRAFRIAYLIEAADDLTSDPDTTKGQSDYLLGLFERIEDAANQSPLFSPLAARSQAITLLLRVDQSAKGNIETAIRSFRTKQAEHPELAYPIAAGAWLFQVRRAASTGSPNPQMKSLIALSPQMIGGAKALLKVEGTGPLFISLIDTIEKIKKSYREGQSLQAIGATCDAFAKQWL